MSSQTMCTLCESDEQLKEAFNEKGEQIFLCEDCCRCEECTEILEEIEQEHWVLVTEIVRDCGYISMKNPDVKKVGIGYVEIEEYKLYCSCCKDLVCLTCKSMNCKERCDECSAPCSENCGCKDPSNQTEGQRLI